jgi:hypothetical protein
MSLSGQFLEDIKKQAERARAGDAQAIQFFAAVENGKNPGWTDIMEVYKTMRIESDSGIRIDQNLIAGLGFIPQQIKDCKEQTFKFAQGEYGAKAFFQGCMAGAAQGVMSSANMLTLRNHILEQMGWTRDGDKMIPPVPRAPVEVRHAPDAPVVETAAPPPQLTREAQQAEIYAKAQGIKADQNTRAALSEAEFRAAQQHGQAGPAPVGGNMPHVDPSTIPSLRTVPAAPAAAPIAAAPITVSAAAALPIVRVSSGMVDRVPSFDMPGAVETIQGAINDDRIFAASVMQVMLDEILKLRGQVFAAKMSQANGGVAVAGSVTATPSPTQPQL